MWYNGRSLGMVQNEQALDYLDGFCTTLSYISHMDYNFTELIKK